MVQAEERFPHETAANPIEFRKEVVGITPEVIEEHLAWLDLESSRYNTFIEDGHEDWAEHAARVKPTIDAEAAFIRENGADEIIALASRIHESGVALENEGHDRKSVITTISSKLPESRSIKLLLRKNTRWGLILDGAMVAQEVEDALAA